MTDMDEGWIAINNRIKAIGLTIEAGDPDWLEHVLALAEGKHAKLEVAIDFILRLNRFSVQADDKFLIEKSQEVLAELTGGKYDRNP